MRQGRDTIFPGKGESVEQSVRTRRGRMVAAADLAAPALVAVAEESKERRRGGASNEHAISKVRGGFCTRSRRRGRSSSVSPFFNLTCEVCQFVIQGRGGESLVAGETRYMVSCEVEGRTLTFTSVSL